MKKNSGAIDLSLYFCRDISSVQCGREFLQELIAAFPSLRWSFVTDDGWWDQHPEAIECCGEMEIPEDRTIDLEEFVQLEWRKHNGGHSVTVWTDDGEVRGSVFVPLAGGVRLRQDYARRPLIGPGSINITLSSSAVTGPLVDDIIDGIARLGCLVQASYGYIKHSRQGIPWRLDQQLAGVFWVTFFGADYVEMIGAKKFESLPCYRTERLRDGSILVIATRDFGESCTAAGFWTRARIAAHLGFKWFWPRPFGKKWYPKLRNLKV